MKEPKALILFFVVAWTAGICCGITLVTPHWIMGITSLFLVTAGILIVTQWDTL